MLFWTQSVKNKNTLGWNKPCLSVTEPSEMSEEKGKLLAKGAGGMRVVECPCKKHYHLSIGQTRVTLSLDEFLSLARTAGRARKQLGASGGLTVRKTAEFYSVQ